MLSADQIFDTSVDFEKKALQIFEFQREKNEVYRRFCDALGIRAVDSLQDIPLLPIKAFKDAQIITPADDPKHKIQSSKFFQSSGTSGMSRSRHFILEPGIYRQSVLQGMQNFYELDEFVIWAYTPGYADNPHSSLIEMLKILIEEEPSGRSRFLELDKPLEEEEIAQIQSFGKKLMLFGAAFGLLDLVSKGKIELPEDSIIIETGGMKTHRREISREELHLKLSNGFGLPKQQIHSEYGMAELLSQAYSLGDEWFRCVPWMKVSIRNPEDPMEEVHHGEEGLIGIADLANIYSCSFILTGDKGTQREDGAFQVLGRWNPQDLRGCNFLIDQD